MKKPNTLNLIFGSIVGLVNNRYLKPTIFVPKKVGKYILLSEIQKEKINKKYGTGIYKRGRDLYFIKTWTGSIRDYDYYSLIKEYLFSKVLSSVVTKNQSMSLKFPEPEGIYKINNSVSVVFKYIEGTSVGTLNKREKTELVAEAIDGLSNLSHKLNKKEKDTFPIRNHSFYLLTLPLITVLAFAFNINTWKIITQSFYLCIKNYFNHKPAELVLAHGDLHPDNLIVSKEGEKHSLYILDCENMILTYRDYDLSLLTLDPQFKFLARDLSVKLQYPASIFLMTYIGLHCAITDNDVFLKKLIENL